MAARGMGREEGEENASLHTPFWQENSWHVIMQFPRH